MRVYSIDALRGFAILGILLMNIFYHGDILYGYVVPVDVPGSDVVSDVLLGIFADGKFRTLFSILFGAGLAIQFSACQRKGYDATLFLKSRLFWLGVIGVFHGVFIFAGDILLTYSICALLVLKYLSLENKILLSKAKFFIVLGGALALIIGLVVIWVAASEPYLGRDNPDFIEAQTWWFSGLHAQILTQAGVLVAFLLMFLTWAFWQVLGLMLLGIYLYRTDFFAKGLPTRWLKPVVLCAVIFTLIDILIRVKFVYAAGATSLISSISSVFVALLYAHIIIKLADNHWFIKLFSAPGKLALSLYIMQSIVMAIVLRWVMPEMHAQATRVDYLLIASGFILCQMALAHVYLKLFNQGPLELLWRTLYLNRFNKKQSLITKSLSQ